MRRGLLGLALAPLLGPPLFLGGLVLADTLVGEGLFLYQLRYDQRLLATQFVGDLVRALPAAYLLAALLAGVGMSIHRLRKSSPWRSMSATGALAGLVLGSVLSGAPDDPSTLLLAVAGFFFALVVSLPLQSLLEARDGARDLQ